MKKNVSIIIMAIAITMLSAFTVKADNANGLILVDGQWNYYVNGAIDTSYTGMANNEYGWWYITNGQLDLSYTGMANNEYGWWYFTNGVLDLGYTGMANNEYGWWYFTNGVLDLGYTGMANNEYGWWYFTNGVLDLDYTGLADNIYGSWYFENGSINFEFTGVYNGKDIVDGFVVGNTINPQFKAYVVNTLDSSYLIYVYVENYGDEDLIIGGDGSMGLAIGYPYSSSSVSVGLVDDKLNRIESYRIAPGERALVSFNMNRKYYVGNKAKIFTPFVYKDIEYYATIKRNASESYYVSADSLRK